MMQEEFTVKDKPEPIVKRPKICPFSQFSCGIACPLYVGSDDQCSIKNIAISLKGMHRMMANND